jgi:subtilisin family serine protease
MNNKLAPELRSLLQSGRGQTKEDASLQKAAAKAAAHAEEAEAEGAARAGESAAAPPEAEESERVGLLIEFTGDLADLLAVGFVVRSLTEHPTQGYKIASGTIPIERLEELAAIEHVVDTEGPRRYLPLLNFSVSEVHANTVHSGTPSRKGDGIVIGVIDSGIDWRHGAFVKPEDSSSRLLALWDQFLTAGSGETAGPSSVGVEYLQATITQALQGNATVRSLDSDGHGTHVAGIAAGNGAPASCCTGVGVYAGVAPKADLIVVKYDYRTTEELGANQSLVDALNYIFNHSSVGTKPVVVNISQGDNLGPHDGTTLVERTINSLVAGGPGRAIVVAAGNFANTQCHVKGRVTGNNNLEIEFKIRDGHEYDAYLDLWYERAGTLNLEVIPNEGTGSGVVNHGANPAPVVVNPTADADRQFSIDVDGTINGAFNRDNNFRILISKPSSGNLPAGDWKLKLINPNPTGVSFHCWIERGDNAPQFLPSVDTPDGKVRSSSDSTLSTPSTAFDAITVANYSGKTDCCDCCPDNDIHQTSSRGPVARIVAAPGVPPNNKPDIAAPGDMITSAKADAANLRGNCCSCCPDACCCLYQDMTGTSMAAPHVAGAIALLLEENHALTKADILTHLQASVTARPSGGTQEAWGAGLLNVQAAINRLRPSSGGGGGGGGGPSHVMPPSHTGFGTDAPGQDLLPGVTTRAALGRAVDFRRVAMTGEREPTGTPQLPPALRILRERIDALPEGQELAAVVSRHFSEVRRLINTNRRIATMWHRGQGPRMLHRLLHGSCDASVIAPISCERQREYVERWLDVLASYGSKRLRASIERYRSLLIWLLRSPLAAQVAAAATAETHE